jgi:hypothetical protein
MKPSVGRIVHVTLPHTDGRCVAAIVTRVDEVDGKFYVEVCAFGQPEAAHMTSAGPDNWHWPERVDE